MGIKDYIIVDDRADIKPLIEYHFNRLKVDSKLHFVSSADECLALLHKLEERETHVITDINMPGMCGEKLSCKLHQSYPTIKVSFMSAYEEEQYSHLKYVYFFKKPLDFEDFVKRLLSS